jgi:L-arabinokinase
MNVKQAPATYEIIHGATHDLPDVEAFLTFLGKLANDPAILVNAAMANEDVNKALSVTGTAPLPGSASIPTAALAPFFSPTEEIVIARAPGRLDLMGGIADYSGSLVLQLPIAEATLVAIQPAHDQSLTVVSLTDGNAMKSLQTPLSFLEQDGKPLEYQFARTHFQAEPDRWVGYVIGVFLVLLRERGVRFKRGARLLISSTVPQGKGVSSSAAIEVAVMSAVAAAFDLKLEANEIALLCQKVENEVVGAPCGVMDQMTSASGEADRLLALRCQPAEVLGKIAIPDDLGVWGLDSGVRHSVAGSDYVSVRTGAFMGYTIIARLAGLQFDQDDPACQTVRLLDDPWRGYLANITPSEFEQRFTPDLPETMTGADFLESFSGTTDSVTRVDATRSYAVRQPAAHAVYEHFRVRIFTELLHATASERSRELLGELMYQSHASYSACGLGSPETDLLVRLVREAGVARGLYGAKITGGGSGGTVAVLGRRGEEGSVTAIAESFERSTGTKCAVFSGSSPGSAAFGHLRIRKGR